MTKPAHQRKAAWGSTLVAVLWAFLGVRRRADYQHDVERLNPLHLVAVGLVVALVFVFSLILLVNWVVKTG